MLQFRNGRMLVVCDCCYLTLFDITMSEQRELDAEAAEHVQPEFCGPECEQRYSPPTDRRSATA